MLGKRKFLFVALSSALVLLWAGAIAAQTGAEQTTWKLTAPVVLVVIGATLSVVMCGLGSGIGISYPGRASLGAMTEDPENFAKYLMLTALPGTQGIYGFVIAFLAASWSGILSGDVPAGLDVVKGWQFLAACLPMVFAGFQSAIFQGKVCASGVNMTTKQPDDAGKALVLGVFIELYAILGLLVSFLLLNSLKPQ